VISFKFENEKIFIKDFVRNLRLFQGEARKFGHSMKILAKNHVPLTNQPAYSRLGYSNNNHRWQLEC